MKLNHCHSAECAQIVEALTAKATAYMEMMDANAKELDRLMAERKPLTDEVRVPLEVLEAAESSLGSFCSDEGWSDQDMQNMDNLSAYIARHKAAHGITGEKNG
jgi:hypothetical protein